SAARSPRRRPRPCVRRNGRASDQLSSLAWSAVWRTSKACRGHMPNHCDRPNLAGSPHRRRETMRKLALSGLVLGTAMIVGTAQAEPLDLTTDQMDQVTAAGYAFVQADKYVNIDEHVRNTTDIFKLKQVLQYVDVQGYFAHADGAANCFGFSGCEAGSYAITDVNAFNGMATSVSGSEAATSGFFRKFSRNSTP